jgi:excisionase family DNA binding protein
VEKLTYTVVEAAEAIGVHHITLRKAIARGDLQSVRIGKRVLIPKRAVEAFLAGQAPGAA